MGYKCQGDMSEWTKCSVVSAAPARRWIVIGGDNSLLLNNYISREFKVPHDYKQEHAFLSMYRPKVATRVIPNLPGVPKSQPAAANGATNGHGWVFSCLV